MNDENKSPRRGMARARSKRSGRSKSMTISRPIIIGLALILAAAAFLFWPRGGSRPSGIGERMSVVTADTGAQSMVPGGEPRSGEVAIENETSDLVPEKAGSSQPAKTETSVDGSSTKASDQSKTPSTPQKVSSAPATTEQQTATTTTKPATSPPPAVTTPRSAQKQPDPIPKLQIQPSDSGGWVIQVGAFGKEENAQKNINELRSRGYPALMHAANTAGGTLLYKVWIGYFKNREEAATYGREHRRQIGESIPVHR